MVPQGAGPGWLLYAFPIVRGDSSHRAFALSDRGIVMWTDNETARYGESGAKPAWTAALGQGGSETFANVLTMPGKGMDGQIWLPLSMQRPQTHVLHLRSPMLRDEQVQVVVGPKSWLRSGTALEVPFPAGIGALDEDGKLALQGIARPDYHLVLIVRNRKLEVVPTRTQLRDGVLEVRVDELALAISLMDSNERSAIAALKNLSSAQAQFHASGAIDCDGDGSPEYGFLGELAGTAFLRSDGNGGVSARKASPPVVSRAFGHVQNARVVRAGYVIQMFLPDGKGGWLAEAPTGGAQGVAVDPRAAGKGWCVYAWPVVHGETGRRAFFLSERGNILATDNAGGRYSGSDKPISAGAAFVNGQTAINGLGSDGERWNVTN
jgi:hypothetical protein